MSSDILSQGRTFASKGILCSCCGTHISSAEPHSASKHIGDVILSFRHNSALDHRYRCSRALLRHASPYFEVLFDPTKFREGREVQRELSKIASTSASDLPVVVVEDIGDISGKDDDWQTALCLFLRIIHETDLSQTGIDKCIKESGHALLLVTLVAIIADRFGANESVAKYIMRIDKKVFEDGKKTYGSNQKEVSLRRRLLTGILLGFSDWVRPASASLVCKGSERWMTESAQSDAGMSDFRKKSPWWRLPGGMEEELQYRRECILETIGSLPKHFIDLYNGKQLQCTMGYDSSPPCDSYQYAEMVRYFVRKGLIQLSCTYAPDDGYSSYAGEVASILEKLRQCPWNQGLSNHGHCGLRTRLLPLLDTLFPHGQVGICLKCWNGDREKESWLENPIRGTWTFSKLATLRWTTCPQHAQLKAMYTAEERNWTPSPS